VADLESFDPNGHGTQIAGTTVAWLRLYNYSYGYGYSYSYSYDYCHIHTYIGY
jgi:hypothetical protein